MSSSQAITWKYKGVIKQIPIPDAHVDGVIAMVGALMMISLMATVIGAGMGSPVLGIGAAVTAISSFLFVQYGIKPTRQ